MYANMLFGAQKNVPWFLILEALHFCIVWAQNINTVFKTLKQ